MRVLVVDDSANVRARLAALVREIGGVDVVDEREDAEGAVAHVLAHQPELVILDLHMPGGSGIAALRRMKAHSAPPLVIVVTNDPSDFNRQHCMGRGADFFFDKAREFDCVLEVVSRAVGRVADGRMVGDPPTCTTARSYG